VEGIECEAANNPRLVMSRGTVMAVKTTSAACMASFRIFGMFIARLIMEWQRDGRRNLAGTIRWRVPIT
jgi:hypothetical protein